jgi:hypothetical protein
MLLVQATTWYRSKSSAVFLGSEQKKVLAMQMAEAGVEENIADLAKRQVKVIAGMVDVSTYDHKSLNGGHYTSKLTAVAVGPKADTVDITSIGVIGSVRQTIQTRLRLNKYLDTTHTAISYVTPETTSVVASVSVPDTARDTTTLASSAMPAFTTTASYSACIASAATKCNVCHLLGGNVASAVVLNVLKGFNLNTHNTHVGDYVSLDGTCGLYKPVVSETITFHTESDTTFTIVDKTVYDTTAVIDTAIKVQILTWR